MLYIVATPIGNIGDLSPRAVEVLSTVDLIAAEDTRRCGQLLAHIGVHCRVVAYHDHNEERRLAMLLAELAAGRNVALLCDAGTPLVSDPGFRLVRGALDGGVRVVPIPGACAAIAALSIAGLPSDRFVFEGFLSARSGARQARLLELQQERRTMILYESPRRIVALLQDVVAVLGAEREVVMARELTKTHETVLRGSCAHVLQCVAADAEQQLGEIVLLVRGAEEVPAGSVNLDTQHLLVVLLKHMPLREAVACAVEISGQSRNDLYRKALALESR